MFLIIEVEKQFFDLAFTDFQSGRQQLDIILENKLFQNMLIESFI